MNALTTTACSCTSLTGCASGVSSLCGKAHMAVASSHDKAPFGAFSVSCYSYGYWYSIHIQGH